MNRIAEDILMHYGVKRRSGRYPWGSGENPYQHGSDFLARYDELKAEGKSEREIAEAFGLSTTMLRTQVKTANHERRELLAARAQSLRDDGLSLNEIAKEMGYANDSSVRALLNKDTAQNKTKGKATAEALKKEIEEKGAIDIGEGVEDQLGVSKGVLKEATFILETEGYSHFGFGVKNVTNPNVQTTMDVLAKPEITQLDCYKDPTLVKSVGEYHSPDGGESFDKREYPASVDSKRIEIRYGDQGGSDMDGVIQLRRGVPDLSLGDSHYAQVRILVDGDHYLKGMAMYADDLPDGVDIRFNTNKKTGTPKMDVLKPIETKDPDDPFGAYIKAGGQSWYTDANGNKKLSAINKLKEDGDWEDMSKNLSSQFLSKQPMQLIKRQLNLTYADSLSEFDEICSYTNPTVKQKMLDDFANECESAAVHMKAAALPRQTTQVVLPMPFLKDNEVYAPNYNNGEEVALVRYPHAGTFEIPVLTVNNKNKRAREILDPTTKDAIGINMKTANRLSGADFDGDFVIAIPLSDKVKVKSTRPLKDLEGFDPKEAYPHVDGARIMSKKAKGNQMGIISNLITDMQLRGATEEELARAVKHSMVVIDAPKHKLDYKKSELDNGISELRKKYQGRIDEDGKEKTGAYTLLSRRKTEVEVPERKGSPRIDPTTGKLVYKTSGREYVDKDGNVVQAKSKSPLILETDDVRTLSTGTPQENAYADYANKMKALAQKARIERLNTPNQKQVPSAKVTYEDEVNSLNAKLKLAKMNAPKEREAQRIATSIVNAKVEANPDLDKSDIKKLRNREIASARAKVGADGKKSRINMTDKEWEAIQAGAVSHSTLESILRYCDQDSIRQRALPKTTTQLSSAKQNKIKAMAASGYTNAEIANMMGLSASTVSKYSS